MDIERCRSILKEKKSRYPLDPVDLDRLAGIISSIDRPDDVIMKEFDLYISFYVMGQESNRYRELKIHL